MTLGLNDGGSEWDLKRIGTAEEVLSREKEIQAIREQLAQVEELERRKAEIDAELKKVWTDEGELESPSYLPEENTEQAESKVEEIEEDSAEDIGAKAVDEDRQTEGELNDQESRIKESNKDKEGTQEKKES